MVQEERRGVIAAPRLTLIKNSRMPPGSAVNPEGDAVGIARIGFARHHPYPIAPLSLIVGTVAVIGLLFFGSGDRGADLHSGGRGRGGSPRSCGCVR